MAETARETVARAGGNLRAVLPYADLREWLAEAEKLGEVTVAKGLGKDAEIGQAAELVMHSDEADCVVFDEIPGHEPGYRVLVNFFGGRRKNMTLGFPTDLSKIELSEAITTPSSRTSSRSRMSPSRTGRSPRTCWRATTWTSAGSPRRSGIRPTAATISAPAATTLRSIPTPAG